MNEFAKLAADVMQDQFGAWHSRSFVGTRNGIESCRVRQASDGSAIPLILAGSCRSTSRVLSSHSESAWDQVAVRFDPCSATAEAEEDWKTYSLSNEASSHGCRLVTCSPVAFDLHYPFSDDSESCSL